MSGILDNKTRLIDTIITLEGRRQMVDGKFTIKYATFTDGATFYTPDIDSGSADISNRIYLESCNLPQDMIAFESDDSGRLVQFTSVSGYNVLGGSVFTGSLVQSLSGSDLSNAVEPLIASSAKHFSMLQTIGTIDPIFEDDDFGISISNKDFVINDNNPISDEGLKTVNVDHASSIFQDKRFSTLPNFKYLPPVNKLPKNVNIATDDIKKYRLGQYVRLNAGEISLSDIETEISDSEMKGNVANIIFNPTSLNNKLFAQFFEVRNSDLLKLDILDLGIFQTGNPESPTKHILYAGRLYTDGNGTLTFIKIFTLVFE
jgi:hypothetical protein